MCKLTHVGHAQYYKGDGQSFRDFLKDEYPDLNLSNECFDQAEHSKRQDWSLEASYDIFPLIEPLMGRQTLLSTIDIVNRCI
jgi:hypothetical protein